MEILRVGGRLRSLRRYQMRVSIRFFKFNASELVITEQLKRLEHAGRQQVIATLKETLGILKVNSRTRSVLAKCVKCRKLQGQALTQKMANLPRKD